MKHNHIFMTTLISVPFIWALSNSMIIPILPRIRESLELTQVQGGLIITALSLPTALLLPLTGFLSDRFGRIRVMIPAIALYGAGGAVGFGAGILSSYSLLLIARVLQGMGATGTTLVAMSLTGDIFHGKKRIAVISYLESANSVGKLTSPLIGGVLTSVAWYAAFAVYPLLAIPIVIGLWYLGQDVEDKPKKITLKDYFSSLSSVVGRKRTSIFALFLTTFIAVFVWFGNLFFLSETMATKFNLAGPARGLLLSLPILTLAVTPLVVSKFGAKSSLVKLATAGLGVISATLLATVLLPDYFLLYGTVGLVGIGLGLTLPALNTMVVSCIDEKERGIMTASYGSVRALGSALGPVGFGWLMSFGNSAVLIIAASLGLVGSIVAFFLIDEKEMYPKNKP